LIEHEGDGETFRTRDMERLWEAKTVFEEHLLSLANVHGLGIGYKMIAEQETRELALVVLVDEKVSRSRLDPRDRVPEQLTFISANDGREISVATRSSPAVRFQDKQRQARPRGVSHHASPLGCGSGSRRLSDLYRPRHRQGHESV
jgi:hypothetical protein